MRWLFLLVLSLNIAYIAWQMNVPAADEYVQSPLVKNAKSIVLLRELKESVEAEQSVVEQSESVQPDIVRQDSKVETPNIDENKNVAVDYAQEVDATISAEVVAETKVAQLATPANSCFTVGPFRDLENLRGYVREIKSYVIQADFRDREEKERSIYWVYIEPEKNRKSAIEAGRRLKAKNIKDYYVIRKGEKNNGISLGHFKSKNRAYGLAKKVKKLGFDVQVELLFKSYTLYWLDYQLVSGASIPETIDSKYIQSNSKENISRLRHDCES